MSALSFSFWNFAAPPQDAATRWNTLWQVASDATPIGRWEHILNYVDHRSSRKRGIALIVEHNGQLVAALPLRADRVCKFVPAWRAMAEAWAWAGDLLVDPTAENQAAIFDCLIRGIHSLRRPWVWFDAIALQQPAWRGFIAACERAGLKTVERPHFEIGEIAIHGPDAARDWEAYEAGRSRNQRQAIKKARRRAEELGGVESETHRPTDPTTVAALVLRGFVVEDKSWKGPAGTSVLRTPGAIEFYIDQAEQLARDGELELTFLRHDGEDIAFEYGWRSRGVYYTPKIGYDERFAHLSPSQLLRGLKLQEHFADPTCIKLDFCGPLAEATAKWTTSSMLYSGLIVGTGRGGNLLLGLAEKFGPGIRSAIQSFRGKLGRGASVKSISTNTEPASNSKSYEAAIPSAPQSSRTPIVPDQCDLTPSS